MGLVGDESNGAENLVFLQTENLAMLAFLPMQLALDEKSLS